MANTDMRATFDFNLEPADNSDDEQQTGRLKVSVADAETNKVLSGASVDVNAKETGFTDAKETGSDGFATFDNVPVVELTVSVSMTGYETVTHTVGLSQFE